jgi:5,5'-dehydrodivanillate O-demethylase
VLTGADKEKLVQVGPHTPAGRLLREYWHPICPSAELDGEGAILTFELLGEQLVVYRGLSGELGVLPERCPHRGASLAYGFVEPRGLRCAYHGWLFDAHGQCIERPLETAPVTPRCHLPRYSAREQAGLVFISLHRSGPPPFPLWDILAREDGGFRIDLQQDLACNWLQIQENAADVTHTIYLHSHVMAVRGIPDSTGFSAPLREFGFQPFEYGLVKSWTYDGPDGAPLRGWGNPLVFPTMMRIETEMHWRIPINDRQTRVIILSFDPAGHGVVTHRLPARQDSEGRYTMTDFYSQDAMAWETQGAIADRTNEVLGASDVGIVMYRDMLRSAIAANEAGLEPPARGGEGVIDLRAWMNGYLPMSAPPDPTPTERHSREQVFDKRHRSYTIPVVSSPPPPSSSAAKHVEALELL